MRARSLEVLVSLSIAGIALFGVALLRGQQAAPQEQAAASAPAADLPPVPKGVEVMARGPVHEAFATPTTEPVPTTEVTKQPPKVLDELPPAEKPEGEAVWIGGYWAWDDDRKDFLWVSGTWRTPPPGKEWIAGYWKDNGAKWQWVPGYWTVTAPQGGTNQQVTYYPEPPKPPDVAPPAQPPKPNTFYVPGAWEWRGDAYVWRAGYWAEVQPGYVWVAAHYNWTPGGYIYVPGYWDLALSRRGILYAPVVVNTDVVGATFVYSPVYAVPPTVVVDAMFVRPCFCHYYFGDYYGSAYCSLGFESCAVYSCRCYDSVFVYERWEHRSDPAWLSVQIDICRGRDAGRIDCPPRTLVQQNTIIQNNVTNVTNVTNNTTINKTVNNTTNVANNTTNINKNVNKTQMIMPASKVAAATGMRTVALDQSARMQAKQQAQAVQQVAMQRSKAEVASSSGPPKQPRVASLSVPKQQTVGPRPPASSTTTNARGLTQPGGTRSGGATTATQSGVKPPSSGQNTSGRGPGAGAGQRAGTTSPPAGPPGYHPPSGTRGQHPPGTLPNGQPARMPPGSPPNGPAGRGQPMRTPPGSPQHPPQRPDPEKKKPSDSGR